MIPEDLKYHREHMWIRVQGRRGTIGITHFAQEQLGDVVYIEIPEVGMDAAADAHIGEIESTKTTAPIEAPVSGRIVEVNEELEDSPDLVNEDPYGRGWIAVIEMSEPKELEDLMDAKGYRAHLKSEHE
ncbi:MAG: glycine cleavage system protein GcvH [Nitrospirae bacterium]|nr:glycine cleavage system protein GcvH [Nitrospirota bacterium]